MNFYFYSYPQKQVIAVWKGNPQKGCILVWPNKLSFALEIGCKIAVLLLRNSGKITEFDVAYSFSAQKG